jgi:hypothetical protein
MQQVLFGSMRVMEMLCPRKIDEVKCVFEQNVFYKLRRREDMEGGRNRGYSI